jgi:hypothetical protein
MAAAWALIGILVGVSNGIHVGGGTLNLLTQVFAAAVLFSMLGLLLGIVFDSRRESVVGSVIGLLVALIATLAGARIEVGCLTSIGLAAGGIFGATVCPLARLVFRFVRCVKANPSGRATTGPVSEDKGSVFDGNHHLSLNRDEPFQVILHGRR